MFFGLSDEQAEIRDAVRDFAQSEIAPRAEEWDERQIFPREVFDQMAGMGLLGLLVPDWLGGSQLSRLTSALVYEQVGMADMGVAVSLSVHNMVAGLIYTFGSDEQRNRWLPAMATGKQIGAFALSEAHAGSDAANIQCSARREGDVFVVNGSKFWVTGAGVADVYLVFVRTNPNARSRGVSALVVEKGTRGFSIGKIERKMGLHSSPTGELIFEDARVPAANLLGGEGEGLKIERKMGLHSSPTGELIFEDARVPAANLLGGEGEGLKIALSGLDGGRINIGAIATGVSQAALDVAIRYARERQAFGKPIGAFEGIQFLLADMAMKVEAGRLLVYQAAFKMDTNAPVTLYSAMAKCFATDAAMEVTTNAVQVLGGAGYVKDWPVERYMRDVKVAQIFEGTNQIQRVVIARALLGESASA